MSEGADLLKSDKLQFYSKEVKIDKTQKYSYDVSTWLNGDILTSASAQSEFNRFAVSACTISGSVISFFVTGVSVGWDNIQLSYNTTTQSEIDLIGVYLQAVDSSVVPSIKNFISPDGYLIADGYLLSDSYLLSGV